MGNFGPKGRASFDGPRKKPMPQLPRLSTYLQHQSAPEIVNEVRKLH